MPRRLAAALAATALALVACGGDREAAGGAAAMTGVATGFIVEANRLGAEADATITEINAKLQE